MNLLQLETMKINFMLHKQSNEEKVWYGFHIE